MATKSAAAEMAQQPKTGPGTRLVSLDAFRGFTMFWLMGGKGFVMALAAAIGGSAAGLVAYQLDHSAWEGLRYYDLIWPSFMLMVGVSVPFSFARHPGLGRALKRAAILFLLGALRESLSAGRPYLEELSSALQPIAVAYLAAYWLARYRARVAAWAAVGILAGYALVLAFVPAPGIAAGTYVPNHNLVTWVDMQVLGRAHPEGWGTVICTVPTIATTLLGLIFGKLLIGTSSHATRMKAIAAAGVGCLAAGYALSPFIPVVMKLWTTTYGLLSAGWACLIFLFLYWLVDARGYRRWAFPLTVIGMNALAAYLGPTLVPTHRIASIFVKPYGRLALASTVLAVNWLILLWMYRRKIFLRA